MSTKVRTWRSWHRRSALAILAHTFLSVMAATEPPSEDRHTLIHLTRSEIRRLLMTAIDSTQPKPAPASYTRRAAIGT